MDITGIQTLEEVIGKLHQRGVRILLCEANERVLGKLRKAGILDVLRQADYGADFRAVLAQAVGAAE